MKRVLLFLLGVVLVIVPEIMRVYYIMPFPGSQENIPTDTRQVDIAYWLHNHIWWIRLIGLALLIGPFWHYMRNGNAWKRIGILVPTALCVLVFYAFNFRFMADKMFYPPKVKEMSAPVVNDSTKNDLVITVMHKGDARAYPIELIGYHHQVLDTVGGQPVLVTYCTVCRTGRAWKPEVNGEPETFRLVGMDHFNAMFEDSRTGSWWRQVTGECIEGPLKGQLLDEVLSSQMTLAEFASRHPQGLVFQPDENFTERYAGLKGFNDGTIPSSLEYRDSASWEPKSWVVGVERNGVARAYDWNDLKRSERLVDTLGGDRIRIIGKKGNPGFLAERITGHEQHRELSAQGDTVVVLREITEPIPAYQEFWHSWRTFHPNTTKYEARK
jgi:hypothetical protein